MAVLPFKEVSLAWFEVFQHSVWLGASQHLREDYSERPDVRWLSVPRMREYDLWSTVPARLDTASHLSFALVECVLVVAAVDGYPLFVLFLS